MSSHRARRPPGVGRDRCGEPVIQPRPRTIPEATVARLAVYLRVLTALADGGRSTVSSGELAAAAGVNPAGLRKDLSHLGPCGVRGVGYEVAHPARPHLRRPRRRAVPGLRAGRHRQPRARRWPTTPASAPAGFEFVGLFDAAAGPGRPADRRADRAPDRRAGGRRRRDPGLHRGHHDAGRGGPVGLRPAGRGRGAEHLELRAGDAGRARRASTSARSTCPSSCRCSPSSASSAWSRPWSEPA